MLFYSFMLYVIVSMYLQMVTSTTDPEIVPRSQWKARPPVSIQPLSNPVPYVVIHHSYEPSACYNLEDCIKAVQWIQDFHQLNHSWADIGYNFLVGSDGRVYEGRGWSRVGAHAPTYNFFSIGICLIGDWSEQLPPENQIATVQNLIQMGVREKMIQDDYKLVGHKQVRAGTVCPGDKLYSALCKWPHYYEHPPSPSALPHFSTHQPEPVKNNKLKKRTVTSS